MESRIVLSFNMENKERKMLTFNQQEYQTMGESDRLYGRHAVLRS